MNSPSFRECLSYIGIAFIIAMFAMNIILPALKGKYRNIVKKGENATATIIKINQTPGGGNGMLNVNLEISFLNKSGENIKTEFNTRIPTLYIEKYKPGEKVKIKYLEKKPTNVILSPDFPYE